MDQSPQVRRGTVTPVRVTSALTLLAVLGAIVYGGGLFHRMPPDSELRNRFFQHETDFVKLVRMSDLDARVTLIRPNFTYLDTDASWPRKDIGFSEDRWNEYRSLFRSLNIDGGVTRRTDYPSSVFINVYASGGVLGSSEKGSLYSETTAYANRRIP